MPFDDINTTECKSWEDFIIAVRSGDGVPMDPVFRGHASCDWGLVPPISRASLQQYNQLKQSGADAKLPAPSPSGQAKYFQHLATGLPGVDLSGMNATDIEALARHHGLVSNLLDWTKSPYVAAFFAFVGAMDMQNNGKVSSGAISFEATVQPEQPICIWRLGISSNISVEGEFEFLTSLSATNQWQKAQQGMFTRLIHDDHIDVIPYLASRDLSQCLHRFTIPGFETRKALHDLENMNITFATLFPDLQGAAKQANIGMAWHFGH